MNLQKLIEKIRTEHSKDPYEAVSIDGLFGGISSDVHFDGGKLARETLAKIESVKREDGRSDQT